MHLAIAKQSRAYRAFTLVEMLVGLAVAAILLRLVEPAFAEWILSIRVMQEAQHLANGMNLARSEAIKRGLRVNLCKSADGRQCTPGSAWHGGWIIHADPEAAGQIVAPSDLVRAWGPVQPGVTVSANRPLADYVSYTAYGHARMLNGALQIGTLTVCAHNQKAVDVVLSAGGRARIARTPSICP